LVLSLLQLLITILENLAPFIANLFRSMRVEEQFGGTNGRSFIMQRTSFALASLSRKGRASFATAMLEAEMDDVENTEVMIALE